MVNEARHGDEVRFGGMISQTRVMTTKKGGRFVRCKVEDFTGQVECVMWPDDSPGTPTSSRTTASSFSRRGSKTTSATAAKMVVLRRLMTLDQARTELTKGMV